MTTALIDFNRTDTGFPATGYPGLLAEQAARTPDAPALVQGDRSWTYSELEAATNRLAHALIAHGAASGERIGLCYPRGAEYVIGSLAILKTGAAIVALDPVNPDDRLAAMIADAGPLLVLTPPGIAPRLPEGVARADVATAGRGMPETPTGVPTGPDTISHLIYTSGSTGTPKAVLERHGALTNLVHWTGRAYGVRPGDRASWMSTPGFAVQIMEWLPYLPLGAAIHIPEAGQAQTPEQIRDWLTTERITHTMLVAALAEPVWGLAWPRDTALRILVTTAERVHSWPLTDTPFRVVMTYGTTETTNVLTCLDLGAGVDFTSQATPEEIRATRQVPVGVPIANMRVHLLDEEDRPVADGEVGRLHVSGAGVAAGYHGRPELTAAKFRSGVVADDPYPVLYDTGDLARRREDGAVELLGRSDAQVKIRGFRVELGEVETHVARVDGVAEAVVVTQERGADDKRLVAYVSADGATAPDTGAIRAAVARTLPYYMVPGTVVVLPALPRLANGKVDRRSLPEPPEPHEGVTAGYEPPRNEVEDGLARLWAEAFRTEGVGIHDNFFELGGHSLLAFQLIDEIRRRYGVELSLSDLSSRPTVAELGTLVVAEGADGRGDFGGLAAIVPDPAARFEPFPLTESQQALWIGRGGLVELGNVGCHGYFEWESEHLDVPRFESAWRRLVERHDALRTRILPDGTQQVYEEIPAYDIPVTDLGRLDPAAREAELAALRQRLSHQVLDADSWPLFDVRISLLGGGRARIHLSLDFLVADAWSYFQVLIPDLVTYYTEPGAELPPLELTFRDYVLSVGSSLRDSELYRRSEWYWRDRLATLPPAPELPARPADAPELPVRFERLSHVVPAELWNRIQERAGDRRVTPSGVLAAAYAEILGSASGQARFTINFPLFNRLPLHPQVNALLADTTTTLLLAVEQRDTTFAGRAQAVQRRLWADLEHRYFSGVQVLRELTRLRGSLAPAMPVVMTSLAGHPPQYEETELGVPVYGISQTPQVSLDFQVFEKAGGLTFNWDHLPAVYPDGLVESMFRDFVALLEALGEEETWERFSPPPGEEGTAAAESVEERDTGDAWERYWAGIERTGRGGDVIWDADSGEEFQWLLGQARRHFGNDLPVIDLGCGNGRYSRELAPHYPRVVGVDVSVSAVEHAVREARAEGVANVEYLAVDMTDADQADALGEGPYNIFVRGVFHVLDSAARARLAAVAGRLLGRDGVLIVHEPDYSDNSFGYLGFVGGKRGRAEDLVGPLEAAGVRHSQRFTRPELTAAFPADDWEVLDDRAIRLHAIDPRSDAEALLLPGYYAVLRRRR
ncbi:non-ribosomal peptide synthetase [Streptomyces sp. TRM49041]|uniref:non-ribosomal peptide synthetase n=1 Tax=Streptomyces sp. TRM49041 TaxID=2603216 RepID=UPI00165687D2|nr:non-ribosomal peptide synthetase [Streptomyces sp. TRM49041]